MAVRYIGSKARIVDEIMAIVGPPAPGDGLFVDAFTGTGVVAAAAADHGWPVRLNDSLYCATLLAAAQITAEVQVPFRGVGGYQRAVDALNKARPKPGCIWNEYSPASVAHASVERRYFTKDNAKLVDGIRALIAKWAAAGSVTKAEEQLLIADLLVAVNRVANIAGTYGCFLREFGPNALQPLRLNCRPLRTSPVMLSVHCGDVYDVPSAPNDTVYYDPPYTKRQYAAYYHILETVAVGDTPQVTGVTGLRPWQHKASVFCYKTKALNALVDLIASTDARRILLSYSDEGHVDLNHLLPRLENLGEVRLHKLAEIGRYRPNQRAAEARASIHEFLVELVKTDAVELPSATDLRAKPAKALSQSGASR